MKLFLITGLFLFAFQAVSGQTLKSDSLFMPAVKQFQFNLEKHAVKMEELQYEQSGQPVKGSLSRDGYRVIMDHYLKGQRVKVQVTYADGTSETISRSPCYIDPVKYEL
jgi:hypothetical protein